MKQWQSKTFGHKESNSRREVYSNTVLPEEIRKFSNEQPKLTPKATRERTKLKVSTGKENLMIRGEISEIEVEKITEKINESKSWLFEKINKIDKPLARLIKRKKGEGSNQ